MSGTGSEASGDDYFRAIETTFIRLRGAPLLLSPADWQIARKWHEEGIPLEVVRDALESVFERLRDRDPEKKISRLSYCAPAVEAAWREIRDLSAVAGRATPEPIDVAGRVATLVRSLDDAPPVVAGVREAMAALAGDAETVERALFVLDARLLDAAEESLDAAARQHLERRADEALRRAVSGRGMAPDLEARRRLYREFVRRHLELPTLSLFAAAAETSSGS